MDLTRCDLLGGQEHQTTSLLDDDLTYMVVERAVGG